MRSGKQPSGAPLFYTFNSAEQIVEVTYHQQPTIEQWERTMEEILSKLGSSRIWSFLLDREALHIGADEAYIRRMVRFIDDHFPVEGSRRWAIAVTDASSHAMGLLAEKLTRHEGCIRVFYDRAQAIAWLSSAR